MNPLIHQILLVFFIFPVLIIQSKNSCPKSSCRDSYLPITYPFKLQTDQPPRNCYNFIELRCSDDGRAIINLPSSGDFYVTFIDYISQRIHLTDPGNCLSGRLMMANLSVYPLSAYFYENYMYYTCPKERMRRPMSEIHCLSNSMNATIATTELSSEFMKEAYGCEPIVSSLVPVSWSSEYNYSGNFGELELTWNVSGCRECEEFYPQDSGDSKSKLARFSGSPAFISIVVLLTLFVISCLLRVMKLTEGGATTADDAATSSTPQASGGTPTTPLPETTNGPIGAQNSQVKNFSEVVGLGESQGTSVSCSICLEEYCGKDKVRKLGHCGHYFHAQCIDQWLQKYNTCPVCRSSLS